MPLKLLENRRSRRAILLTKTTAAQNDVALSYLRLRGLYFLAVVFAAAIITRGSLSHSFPLAVDI